jgi:hypothetical protein
MSGSIRSKSDPLLRRFTSSDAPARWAALDAVVAQAYGLTRDQYARVLSTFSHATYKDAPRQCLAAFDELQSLGLEAFTKKHDPYWDVPLNENLHQPVIDLPIPAAALREDGTPYRTAELFAFQTTPAPAGTDQLFTEHPVTRNPIIALDRGIEQCHQAAAPRLRRT